MRYTLKFAIIRAGLTQCELAIRARIYETRLSKIVCGHVAPTADERTALARELAMPADELFAEERARVA